jgi:hypothetical protein
MAAITKWRLAVLEEHSQWKQRVDKLRMAYDKAEKEYNSTRRLDYFFEVTKSGMFFFQQNDFSDTWVSLESKDPLPPSLPVFPPQPFRPIINEICANSLGAFSVFGRHTANDFLFLRYFPACLRT